MTSRREVTVNLEKGLHLVPCSRIVEHVRDYEGAIQIQRDDVVVDAKSIFDLMTLAAPQGTVLVLAAQGDGAEQLVEGLAELFKDNFGT